MQLQTSFGSIRPYVRSDAEALARSANHREVWLGLRDAFPHPYGLEDAHRFLDAVDRQAPTTFFAIATHEVVGGIGLGRGKDVHRLTAELGYWLTPSSWGRGIMSEAVARFTEACFAEFDLERIFAEPYDTNVASCRVLEKAGFEREGVLRRNVLKAGKVLDQVLYARLRAR
jgi:RimJ/RimL family protein N-acetyltransferase